MSNTYTLSQFSTICGMLPTEALQIVTTDIWFSINAKTDTKRFVKFAIKNNSPLIGFETELPRSQKNGHKMLMTKCRLVFSFGTFLLRLSLWTRN